MEHLAFHAGECEHRDESQDDDGHREENRSAYELGCFQSDLANRRLVLAMFFVVLLCVPQHVFGHHDPGIDQHPNRNRYSAQRHDVGGDVGVVHEQERSRDRKW